MKAIPVLIADKYDISRAGLATLLDKASGVKVLQSVKSASELIKQYKKEPKSVCIISSNIQDSNIHEVMEKLRDISEEPVVIVISNAADLTHLNQALKAGISGYLTKNVSSRELTSAVKSAKDGERAFSKSVSKLIVGKYADYTKKGNSPAKTITKREKEILNLIVDGYTSAEIAEMLYISPRTVETHRSNLMQKLKIKNTAGLVRYALEEGKML